MCVQLLGVLRSVTGYPFQVVDPRYARGRSDVRLTRALLLALVIGLLPITSFTALADDEELDELESELGEVEAGLEEAMARLDAARRELDQVESRLSAANAELGRTQTAYEQAEIDYEEAVEEAERTATALILAEQRLERAEQLLAAALDREETAIERLEARVVKAFKDGSTHPTIGLAQGIINAGNWHDIARSTQIYQRTVADDRSLVQEALDARREADLARAEANAAQREAQDLAILAEAAEQRAADELDELERLVEERQAAVNQVAAEHARRESIFQELEADASVMQALANELQSRIAQLRGGGVCQGRVPAGASVFSPGSLPGWAQRLVSRISRANDWVHAVAVASSKHGVDPRVMSALVWSESAFRPDAVSRAGAIGLAQLMPGTARGLGVDPWNPEQNLDGGARYLAMQVDRFGSLELGLAAYNAGPGNVIRYGGIPPFAETQIYVVRVIERCQAIAG